MKAITFVVALALAASLTLAAGEQPAQPAFTAAQVSAGQASYQANCASCHLADLAGQNEAPQLAGPNFFRTWRNAWMICVSSSRSTEPTPHTGERF